MKGFAGVTDTENGPRLMAYGIRQAWRTLVLEDFKDKRERIQESKDLEA